MVIGGYLDLDAKSIVQQPNDETEGEGVAESHGGAHGNVTGFPRSARRINGADAVKKALRVPNTSQVGLVHNGKQEYTGCPDNA